MYQKFEETEVAPIKPGLRPNLHKLNEIHELYVYWLKSLDLWELSVYLYCYWYKCFWVNSVQSAREKWINQAKVP